MHEGLSLTRVFFPGSGSNSAEVVLKMALDLWAHTNRTRSSLLALEHSYNGDAIGRCRWGLAQGAQRTLGDAAVLCGVPSLSSGRRRQYA